MYGIPIYQLSYIVYPTITNFTQTKRKTYDANYLLVLSLLNIIVSICSLGKKFCCIYLLFYGKPFN